MAKFMKGQDPRKGLEELKKYMESKLSEINETQDSKIKRNIIKESLTEYTDKMGSLTTIFKGDKSERENRAVEKLKREIRGFFDRIKTVDDEFHRLGILDVKAKSQRPKVVEPSQVDIEITKAFQKIHEQHIKINVILEELDKNIGNSAQHHSTEAIGMAKTVKQNLREAANAYSDEFEELIKNTFERGFTTPHEKIMFHERIKNLDSDFKNKCNEMVKQAMPTFKKDMELGDYLKNAARKLANAVIKIVTLNDVPKFFKSTKSTSAQAVKKAGKDLQNPDFIDTTSKTPK